MEETREDKVGDAINLIKTIVEAIVDYPTEVKVEYSGDIGNRYVLSLETSPEDVKHVIGKSGSVIDSIRTLLRVFGGKNKIKIEIDYLTEQQNKRY